MASLGTRHGRLAQAAVATLLVLGFAAPAHADDWRPVGQSCIRTATPGTCATGAGTAGLWNVVVGPGGTTAYGAAWDANTVVVFDRDPSSGRLTQRAAGSNCVENVATSCGTPHGIVNPDGMVISPDGRFLYVSGWSGAIATFSRNTTT